MVRVADLHCDTIIKFQAGADLAADDPQADVCLPSLEQGEVGLERVVDHVEHVVRLVGDEHVGFGSDFDGIPTLPDGITGSGSFPAILDALRIRGLSEQSIERIASGNFLRILG
jgi:microsomal dipeptidase-like Zn-dependent dipeptidase